MLKFKRMKRDAGIERGERDERKILWEGFGVWRVYGIAMDIIAKCSSLTKARAEALG